MKNFLIIAVLLIGTTAFAQNKNAKATIQVDGVCGMCKDRIEKACYGTKGVKLANWSIATHELNLIYNEAKTDLKTIQENIISVGHDTQDMKATDEAYNSVHDCCRYRDVNVVNDH